MNAAEYFRADSGFERLLRLCRDKYVSLSRIGGVRSAALRPTAELVLKTGFAGYQENITDRLLADLQSIR